MKPDYSQYDDQALDAAIKAWGVACEASRDRSHIDVADRIRNELLGERIRRSGPSDGAIRPRPNMPV